MPDLISKTYDDISPGDVVIPNQICRGFCMIIYVSKRLYDSYGNYRTIIFINDKGIVTSSIGEGCDVTVLA